jgi:rubrerythrin
MERDGQAYFEVQAGRMSNKALKQIFDELANDEKRHYEIFKAMSEGKTPSIDEAFKTDILTTTKNVFQQLKDSGEKMEFADDVKQVWIKARDIEDDAESFYREKANEATDSAQKAMWNRIADEEHKHWVAMNNVVNFLSRPEQWLEDAEWTNLEAY